MILDHPERLAVPANDNAGVVAFQPRMVGCDQPFSLDASLDVMRAAWHLKEGGRTPKTRDERDALVAEAAKALVGIDRIDRDRAESGKRPHG